MRAIALILVPAFAFSQIVLVSGLGEGGAFIRIQTLFETDYEHVRALATFRLNVEFCCGNIHFQADNAGDSVKFFYLDIGSVQISYGRLHPSFPVPVPTGENGWILRLDDGYILFDETKGRWVKVGPLVFGAGEKEKGSGVIFDGWIFGGGYMWLKNGGTFVVKFGEVYLGIGRIPFAFLRNDRVNVEVYGHEFRAFFFGEDGYIQIDGERTELVERVGSVYAVWELSGRSWKFGIGFGF